jgi:glycosyltransferase involved in cell wall biosynthesis
MHVGLPVVALAEAAVPETLGDAGLLLERKWPVDVVAAVGRVTEDGDLRDELVRRGRRRAADFALDRTAPAFLDALEPVLEAARTR